MTLPNGPDGVTGGWPFLTSADGNGDNPISGLTGNSQDFVVEVFKEKFIGAPGSATSVFTDPSGTLAQVFGGLRSGISLPLSIIESIVKKFLPFGLGDFLNVGDALAALENGATNLFSLFDMNPTDPGFNTTSIWSNIADVFINPLGKFANLVSGFLPNSQLGGHDASKITSGSFSMSQITGLVTKFLDYPIIGDLIQSLTGVSGGTLATIGATTNLMVNGDFPANITGWTDYTASATWESTIGRTAAGSLKIAAGANNFASGNEIAVTPGDSVYLEAWFRTSSITTGTAASVNLFAVTLDASHVSVSGPFLDGVGISTGTNTTWVKLSGSVVIPASGVSYIAVVPDVTGATGGFVYFDDFKVTKSSSSSATLLPGLIGGVTPGFSLIKDVGDVLKNMFNGITRNTADAASQDEASTAISGQTDIVLGTAATLAALAAGFGPGNPDSDDFERTSTTTLGSNWTSFFSSGSGPLATPNGHDLHYGGGSNTEWISIKNNLQAASDDMEVSIVLAQAIPAWPFFTPLPFGGSIDVWLRCNLPGSYGARTGVMMRVNSAAYSATVTLYNVVAGAATSLASSSMSVPSTGGLLTFNATGYIFTGYLNGGVIGTPYNDAGHATSKGAGFRYRGLGGQNVGGQGSPDLSGWTATG